MTNPRVYLPGHPKTFARDPVTNTFLHIDLEATEKRRNRAVPTEREIETLLAKADLLETEYFRLRAKAVVGIVKIFGKRRAELSLLEIAQDISTDDKFLYVIFTVVKKSKKGLFQYLRFLEKQCKPELLNKPLPILQQEHKDWNNTTEGYRIKRPRKPKNTPLTDKYAKLILDYVLFMRRTYPSAKFLFPSGKTVFGSTYIINNDKALSGRQILNIVEELDPDIWMHLYRKLKGSQVARKYGRTLDSAYQVKTTLDLERTETALRYIEEFVPKTETGEAA